MMIRRIIAIAALVLMTGYLPAIAQKVVLSGYVREADRVVDGPEAGNTVVLFIWCW